MTRSTSIRVGVRRRAAHGTRGQATVETLVTLGFLLFLMLALVHLSLLASAKSLTNLAAFSAGRTMMVRGETCAALSWGGAWSFVAAETVLDALRWSDWSLARVAVEYPKCGVFEKRRGIFVIFNTPFGQPFFQTGVPVTAFSPVAMQPGIPEVGDNAR